jgi:Fe2+ or Zn2+ uptake regulation protein
VKCGFIPNIGTIYQTTWCHVPEEHHHHHLYKLKEGTGAGVYGQSLKRRLSFSLGRYATVFQAEI